MIMEDKNDVLMMKLHTSIPDAEVKYQVSDNNDVVMILRNGAPYVIRHEWLKEDDWISHMLTKAWIDMKKFMIVYFEACQREGINKLNIVTRN